MRGFTLIEILIVMALLGLIMGLGLFMSMDAYRGYSFRSESSVVVSVLEKARSRAMNNMYGTAWGVCFDSANKAYVTFRGVAYTPGAATNESLPAQAGVTISSLPVCGAPSPIVFQQLTGKLFPQLTPATSIITLTVVEGGHTSASITINNEGTINW